MSNVTNLLENLKFEFNCLIVFNIPFYYSLLIYIQNNIKTTFLISRLLILKKIEFSINLVELTRFELVSEKKFTKASTSLVSDLNLIK